MQFFTAEQVHRLLPFSDLVPALIAHHERDVDAVESTVLEQPSAEGGTDSFLALPAWQRGRAIGAKLVSVFPANEHNGSGLPSVQGVYALFDGRNGQLRAVIEGAALTLRKTAADSAAGANFLARKDSGFMLMVGAGALAPHLIIAHVAVRPSIQRVAIWNRTPDRAARLAETLSLDGVEIYATDDIEIARDADVISCATMATEPLICGAWLKPGVHLDLVGSFTPAMHECDEEAIRRGRVYVDSPWSAIRDCGEIVSALENGALRRKDILGDNFTLARGQSPGRRSDDEITIYKNGGGGHLDLMVAQILCDRAEAAP